MSEALSKESRALLDEMRPRLLASKEIYAAYIKLIESSESGPVGLFMAWPALPSGGHAILPTNVERECCEAVVNILKTKLARVDQALGTISVHY